MADGCPPILLAKGFVKRNSYNESYTAFSKNLHWKYGWEESPGCYRTGFRITYDGSNPRDSATESRQPAFGR